MKLKRIKNQITHSVVHSAIEKVEVGTMLQLGTCTYMIIDYTKKGHQWNFVLYRFKENKYKVITQIRKVIVLIRYVLNL